MSLSKHIMNKSVGLKIPTEVSHKNIKGSHQLLTDWNPFFKNELDYQT
jgi:hypothetical protein